MLACVISVIQCYIQKSRKNKRHDVKKIYDFLFRNGSKPLYRILWMEVGIKGVNSLDLSYLQRRKWNEPTEKK